MGREDVWEGSRVFRVELWLGGCVGWKGENVDLARSAFDFRFCSFSESKLRFAWFKVCCGRLVGPDAQAEDQHEIGGDRQMIPAGKTTPAAKRRRRKGEASPT